MELVQRFAPWCLLYSVMFVGLWGSLGFIVVSDRVRDSKYEPWSGTLTRAFCVSVAATLVATQPVSYPSGGDSIGCGGLGLVFMPLFIPYVKSDVEWAAPIQTRLDRSEQEMRERSLPPPGAFPTRERTR